MNILHMKYAIEVAKAGSINKASENLLIAQPNLSRSIKELESDLGITIFERSPRGMILTPGGEEFIGQAKKVLDQIDEIEKMYKAGVSEKQRFSVSVPRASYISDAFARFTRSISDDPAELYYMETNSSNAINNILTSNYRLGIIRYPAEYDKYFKSLLDEKGLKYELVAEFQYVLIMSAESRLAKKREISFEDLSPLIEVTHGDSYVPSVPLSLLKKEEWAESIKRRVYLFERGGQFDLLVENPETFMWASPLPPKLMERYNLIQRTCVDSSRLYRDVLIYRRDYTLSDLDKRFIKLLRESKKKCL